MTPPAKTLSLRLRIGGPIALLFLCGMVALYFAAYFYGRTAADRSFDRLLAGGARSIAESLVVSDGHVDVDIPDSAFDLWHAAPEDSIFYRVFDANGVTITGYADLPGPAQAARIADHAYRADASFFTASYRGEPVRFVVVARAVASAASPWRPYPVSVEMGQTRRAHQALVDELALRSLLPIGLMTIIALLLVWFGLGRALRPLARIGGELTARGPLELDPIRTPAPSEVEPLVLAINGFMGRLNTNIATLRSFVGDAAHQLRTPLAALRAQAQVADRTSVEDMRRSLDAVERNSVRLTRLVNQMLSDATVSHRADARDWSAFDLVEVVREVVHEASAFGGDVTCTVTSTVDQAPLRGDPLMLTEALRNIVNNAVRHGGGTVDIAVQAGPLTYAVEIADRGPGIPDADKARAFDRFVRGTRKGDGAGLGLAIARHALERHDGSVTLADRPGGGLVVRINLPRSNA